MTGSRSGGKHPERGDCADSGADRGAHRGDGVSL